MRTRRSPQLRNPRADTRPAARYSHEADGLPPFSACPKQSKPEAPSQSRQKSEECPWEPWVPQGWVNSAVSACSSLQQLAIVTLLARGSLRPCPQWGPPSFQAVFLSGNPQHSAASQAAQMPGQFPHLKVHRCSEDVQRRDATVAPPIKEVKSPSQSEHYKTCGGPSIRTKQGAPHTKRFEHFEPVTVSEPAHKTTQVQRYRLQMGRTYCVGARQENQQQRKQCHMGWKHCPHRP